MQFLTINVFVAMLAIVNLTTAHMFLISPVPFPGTGKGPLAPGGGNFPCHNVAYTGPTLNQWTVGSTQKLAFNGTAVHGGGSCQVAVTTDKAPTPASKWKVIHSIEGGCPLPPAPGLDRNYVPGTNPVLGSYDFKVPADLPDGDLVFAGLWWNHMGNREMYMYCGSVSVSGGAKDTSAFDKLPDMAVANQPGHDNGCITTEMFDYTFANPGASVFRLGPGPFKPLCGGETIPGTPPANPGAPPANPGIPSPAPVVPGMPSQSPPAPVVPAPSQAPFPSDNGNGKFTSTVRQILTVTASGSAPTPSTHQGAEMVSPPAAKPSPQVSQAVPSAAAPVVPGQACSPDGAVVCSPDSKQFALCNWGKAVFQPVAAGTSCQGGKIAKRADYASTLKTVYT